MKRQGCLFLILILLISLQAKAYALPAAVNRDCEPTKFINNYIYADFIVFPSLGGEGLVYFNARLEGEQVYLDWAVKGDFETSSFIVQRKTRETGFRHVSGIKERGERAELREYSVIDERQDDAASVRQYRLKQVFNDGSVVYHNPITFVVPPKERILIQQDAELDLVKLTFPETEAPSYQINFYDISVRILEQVEVPATPFRNTSYTFDLRKFPSGMIIVAIKSGDERWTEKIIKN